MEHNTFFQDLIGLELKKEEEVRKNFGMLIPADICRHLDGTPCSYIDPSDKPVFVKWLHGKFDDPEKLTGKEKEEQFKIWKSENPDNATDNPKIRTWAMPEDVINKLIETHGEGYVRNMKSFK